MYSVKLTQVLDAILHPLSSREKAIYGNQGVSPGEGAGIFFLFFCSFFFWGGGEGGGVGRGVRPASSNRYPISDQNMWLSLPYFRADPKLNTQQFQTYLGTALICIYIWEGLQIPDFIQATLLRRYVLNYFLFSYI